MSLLELRIWNLVARHNTRPFRIKFGFMYTYYTEYTCGASYRTLTWKSQDYVIRVQYVYVRTRLTPNRMAHLSRSSSDMASSSLTVRCVLTVRGSPIFDMYARTIQTSMVLTVVHLPLQHSIPTFIESTSSYWNQEIGAQGISCQMQTMISQLSYSRTRTVLVSNGTEFYLFIVT